MIAARLATRTAGGDQSIASNEAMTEATAAKLLGVSRSSVQRARKVLNEGTSEEVAAVETGEKGVSARENGEKKKARAVTSLFVDTFYGPKEPIRRERSFDQAALCFSIWHAGASLVDQQFAEQPRRFQGFLVSRSSPQF
jgi:hypothetical protein